MTYTLTVLLLSGTCVFLACHRSGPSETLQPAVQPFAWSTSTPQAQNVNPDSLYHASQDFRSTGYVESFLVVRNGFLVEEQYYTSAGALLNADVAVF